MTSFYTLSDLLLDTPRPATTHSVTHSHAFTRIDTHEEEAVAIFEPQRTATDADTGASALWPGPFFGNSAPTIALADGTAQLDRR